jgi:group II intron reverse transcriptase/maturase
MSAAAASAPKFAEVPARVLAAELDLTTAADRVCAKLGMAGVDGISVSRFRRAGGAALRGLQSRLARQAYLPLPLRVAEVEKKKSQGVLKRRLLLVPTVSDRIAQTAAALWLGVRWNPGLDAASFAYRPGLGVANALRVLAELRERGYRWILDADIRSFFDSISHDILVDKLRQSLGETSPMLVWLRAWITAAVWDGADVRRLCRGVPQGSPLSPLLANFYLDSFDRQLRSAGIHLIRYADDFLVAARTPFELADHRSIVEEGLASLRLSLAPEKTRTVNFEQGFRFLGAEICGDSILLPFEKKKTPLRQVYLAPVMPPALLRAFRAGHMAASMPFFWSTPPPVLPRPARRDPLACLRGPSAQATLDRLRRKSL